MTAGNRDLGGKSGLCHGKLAPAPGIVATCYSCRSVRGHCSAQTRRCAKEALIIREPVADQISETGRILTQSTNPTPERTALEQKLQWDTRIYDDRNQALTFVCESPVLLEQRGYALGKEISRHLN